MSGMSKGSFYIIMGWPQDLPTGDQFSQNIYIRNIAIYSYITNLYIAIYIYQKTFDHEFFFFLFFFHICKKTYMLKQYKTSDAGKTKGSRMKKYSFSDSVMHTFHRKQSVDLELQDVHFVTQNNLQR